MIIAQYEFASPGTHIVEHDVNTSSRHMDSTAAASREIGDSRSGSALQVCASITCACQTRNAVAIDDTGIAP